ncbi:FIST signal transduction protein [Novosphingobium piscinae]|uniref:FIST C-terminal domain-containing protein n=1 Tax=Novosphingobium piscinae TaxID=1507448 RepID=A0A7X1KPZ0_9SPHN|nr:FIST C-terminal domain-containing protein [Novosphingobium piscinae]MBC2668968.1 FIST C-terminal domain-containing protein [Novosphingobium piscinae]
MDTDVVGVEAEISGGMAGDGARFAETLVALNGAVQAGTIAAIGFYGDAIRFGHGCVGGWDGFGPRRRITASAGLVLHALDDRPALDLYETYLGDEAAALPGSGLLYPLCIWDPAKPDALFVRTLLGVDRATRSLLLAGDVPEGWHAQLMRGSIDRLIDGAASAARDAREEMAAQRVHPAACLLVSCVGRRLLMGQHTEAEIEQVHAVLGTGVPMAGYYSYGEIAPRAGSPVAGLHNQTVTLTLLAEAA